MLDIEGKWGVGTTHPGYIHIHIHIHIASGKAARGAAGAAAAPGPLDLPRARRDAAAVNLAACPIDLGARTG